MYSAPGLRHRVSKGAEGCTFSIINTVVYLWRGGFSLTQLGINSGQYNYTKQNVFICKPGLWTV